MIGAHALTRVPGARHGFFTRQGGVSEGLYASLNCGYASGDERDRVRANRALVAAELGIEASHLLTVWQWHSADVMVVRQAWDPLDPPKADAMVTDVAGLALGVLTADCTPVLFADGERRIVGAAHAGWKGALAGVIEATVAAMEGLGAARQNIAAAIGPTISQANYEVGPEFQARFLAADAGHARYFRTSRRAGHFMFDLPGFVAARLTALGLKAVNDVGLCTYGDEARFFSYRRTTHRAEPDYGRQIAAITNAQ